jgi:hypothetical protein
MGHCSAASLIAALLLSKEDEGLGSQLFKGAVFLSRARPWDHVALNDNKIKYLANTNGYGQTAIPTANIWSAKDNLTSVGSSQLASLYNPTTNINFIHEVGSTIPQARDQDALAGAVQAIRRTVDVALFAH